MTRPELLLRLALVCAVVALAIVPAIADDDEEKAAPAASKGLEFAPFSEGNPVHVAVVYGDPAVGPCAVLIKAPAGHRNPMHTHSSSYTAVLIAGSLKQWNDGQTEDDVPVLMPGDTAKQPAGRYHAEAIGDDGMLVFVSFDGPIDFKPKEGESQ